MKPGKPIVVIFGVVFASVVFIFFVWRYLHPKIIVEPPYRTSNSPQIQPPLSAPPQSVQVTPEDHNKSAVVLYDGKIFLPQSLTIPAGAASSGQGCMIAIQNQSPHPLIIRLSPYHAKDDYGFPYPPIPAGESVLIDARYHLTDIALHNRENPKQQFRIHFNPPCR